MSDTSMSALIILVPEAEPLVGDLRQQFDIAARRGLGAHITILVPFRTPASISTTAVSELRTLFAAHRQFKFSLVDVDEFPSAIYLSPEPSGPFTLLTLAVTARFPDCLPYGGAFPDPVPHLTVAQKLEAEHLEGVGNQIRAHIGRSLPLSCAVTEACLVIRTEDRRSIVERFALG